MLPRKIVLCEDGNERAYSVYDVMELAVAVNSGCNVEKGVFINWRAIEVKVRNVYCLLITV